MKTDFTYKSSSGKDISAVKWIPSGDVKGVLIITIGMVEHCRRYDKFATELLEYGIAVFSHDHIGHGETEADTENIGHLEKGGYKHMLADMLIMNKIVHESYPDVPVILYGHSMGSMLSRVYLKKYGDTIDGLVLSGTVGSMPERGVMSVVAKLGSLFGEKKKAQLLYDLSFKSYAKNFEGSDDSRWLSSVDEMAAAYTNDPYCGQVCTFGFYRELADLFLDAMSFKDIEANKKTPIYIGVGELDMFAVKPERVQQNYISTGFNNVNFKKYLGSRHEILNDVGSDEFTSDVINFAIDIIG